jgi:predicted transcriptional regulator
LKSQNQKEIDAWMAKEKSLLADIEALRKEMKKLEKSLTEVQGKIDQEIELRKEA